MERTSSITAERNTFEKRQKLSLLIATCLVLAALLLSLASLPIIRAAPSSAPTYNNVQVFAQTTGTTNFNAFVFTAYNTTGSVVVTSQTQYPAASFELPTGTYIFTAEATQQLVGPMPYKCPVPVAQGVTTGTAASAGVAIPALRAIYCGGFPLSEYGYSQQDISGSSVVNLPMQNLSASPISSVTVKVIYANGTAAAGASVSASVIGASYYGSDTQVLGGTTDSSGVVTLSAPAAPLQVTAWTWIPINLPTNQTTIQRTIGGEKVNVTVYWQPTTIGLGGTTLIVPPQTGASITLHVQQPNYWVVPYTVQSGGIASGVATGAPTTASSGGGVPGGVPASVAQQYPYTQRETIGPVASQYSTTPALSTTAQPAETNAQPAALTIATTTTLAIAGTALVVSALSLTLVVLKARRPV